MEHLLQWLLVSVLASATLAQGCPGDRPMKQLICRQTGPLHDKFDPCLCTHLVLHKDLHQLTSGDAKKAVIDYKAVNPSLQVLGSWAPDGELDLEPSQLAKITNSLELDGVFVESTADPSIPSAKDKLVNLVKVLATELDSLRSSKRAYEKYELDEEKRSHDRPQDTGILVQIPSHPQALGKHYDLKKLSKYVDYYVMETDNITDASENGLAYHPSRLMGIDDVLNADSLVDLASGLGAPVEKLIISLPSSAFTFTLENPEENMPRSKVVGQPKKISQMELCSMMEEGGWMVERDEDLTAPYAYRNNSWIAFDDTTSAAIKGKYILLRDLAGAALDSVQMEDWEGKCKENPSSVVKTLYETFTSIARKPRAAQLLALQEQIHDAYNIPFSDVQLSPYRIVRVVDRAGSIHVVRKEAKTEFTCSRQGYFTHPSGCNRFYRCVKFNQYSSDFTVFEYDCPAGLAFDERYEVCVWPGSLPDANACKGSSEIAPVPRSRYACPGAEGYYADPENCRWFFACLDHRRDGSELTAYEFRCPFGLVFNEKNLVCDWPWYVDGCGSGAGVASISSGFTAADILEGRLRPSFAQVPDVLVSGGRIENVDGGYVLGSSVNAGLQGIQGSGHYRGESSNINAGHLGIHGNLGFGNNLGIGSGSRYHSGIGVGPSKEEIDNSGAYIHDPTGDHGGDYIHQEGPGAAYIHQEGPGAAYVHREGPGAIYVEGNKGSAYIDSSNLGLKATPGLAVVGQTNIGDSGAYIHDSTGDHGIDYIHQEGPGAAYIHQDVPGSAYVAGANKGSAYFGPSTIGIKTTPGLGIIGQTNTDNNGAYIHDSAGDHGGDYTHQEGPGSAYIHQEGSGAAYVAGVNKGSGYIGTSSLGLKTTPIVGVAVGQANIDNSGAYIHDSTGDHGVDYIQQEGPGSAYIHKEGPGAAYIAGVNKGSGYIGTSGLGLKTTPIVGVAVGQANIDNSGAYIHDSTGDHGGDYTHQEGPGSAYVHQEGPGSAYVHQEGPGSAYVHQEGSGAAYVAGVNKGSGYIGASTLGLKTTPIVGVAVGQTNIGNSGAYIHDSTGDHGGDYIHQEGPGSTYVHQAGSGAAYAAGVNKGSGYIGSSTLGLKTTPGLGILGETNVDYSGAYIHDSSGHHGGDYVHQEGPGVAYVAGVNKGSAYVGSSTIGLKTTPGLGIVGQTNIDGVGSHIVSTANFGTKTTPAVGISVGQVVADNSGSYVHDTTGDHGGDYIHQGIRDGGYVQGNVQSSAFRGGVDSSGAYIHDTSGDRGVDYVHQEIRDGGYVNTGGNNVHSGLNIANQGIGSQIQGGLSFTRFTSGLRSGSNVGGNDGQYIHDSTGDRGEEYIHKEGPQGAAYVDDNSGAFIAGLYSGKAVHEGNYYAGAFGNYDNKYHSGAYVHDNSGEYVHDNSGDYVHDVSGKYISTIYNTGRLTIGNQGHYAGGYDNYLRQGGAYAPVNSYIKYKQTGTYPTQYVTNVQPVNYEGIGGAAISSVHSSVNGNFGVKTSIPTQPIYTVTTPKPVTYSTIGVPVSSTLHSSQNVYVNQPTATVSPIVVSSAPAIPLNPVQYATVPQKPLVSFSQVKPSVQTYSVSTSSVPIISHSYKQPVNTFTVTGTPTVPVVSLPVTTPLPPISNVNVYKQKVSQIAPVSITYTHPQTLTQPVSVIKTPVVPLNPVQYNTPAPAFINSYNQPVVSQPIVNTYRQPSLIKTDYHQTVSTPSPALGSYTFGTKLNPAYVTHTISEQKPLQVDVSYVKQEPVVVSSTPSTPIEPVKFVNTVRPIVISTPAPFRTHSESIAIANAPVNPVHLVQPVVSTPAPPVVSFSYNSPSLVHTKLNTIKPIAQKESFSYSYHQPLLKTDYVQPISVSTTPLVPLNPIQYAKPAQIPVAKVDYTFQKPLLNTLEQRKPVDISFTYQQPVVETKVYEQRPVQVGYVTTPAPTIFQKVDSVKQCVNCVSPSLNFKQEKTYIQPISVSTTPVIPLAPVQYVKPLQSAGISSTSYTYQQPALRPVTTFEEQKAEIYKAYIPNREYLPPLPAVVSTAVPPVSYTFEEQKPLKPVFTFQDQRKEIYSKKPYAAPAYLPPVKTVISSTPAPPLVSYSYEQEPVKHIAVEKQTFGSKVVLPPVAPIVSTTPSPIFSYSFEQKPILKAEDVKPVAISNAPYIPLNVNGEVLYGRPVPVKGCTACSLVDDGNVKPVSNVGTYQYESGYNSYAYQETPVKNNVNYHFQPGTYVHTEPKPVVPVYQYKQPIHQVPSIKQEYVPAKPCATCSISQSAAISVTSTPVVPLNTIQYVTTPAPIIKQAPIVPQVKFVQKIQPVVNSYEYQKPLVAVQDHKIVEETFKAPVRPIIDYTYQKSVENLQPIRVSTTPIVPLNRVQYVTKTTPFVVSTTPAPVTYTDSHFYEINKVSHSPAPIVINQPVRPVSTTLRPVSDISYEGYNRQQNSGYSVSRLSSPAPFRTQYKEDAGYTATVTQSPVTVGVVKGSPTPVFEEYFGIDKTNIGSVGVGQLDINSQYKGDVRVPSVTFSTPAPSLNTVKYNFESRLPINQYQYKTTVAPTSGAIKYSVRYKQPSPIVSQPVVSELPLVDNIDESLNAHIDIAKINIDSRDQYYIPTSTFVPSTTRINVIPTVKRVNVDGGQGYYVRKQKVRVRPVVTTTENYPSIYTTTYKPLVYSSTLDLTSPTLYTTTVRPVITSSLSSAELDIETSDEDKLVDEVSGNFGEVINVGNQGVIAQKINGYSGLSSTTVASLKEGEAIVGVIKKTRVSVDGRKKAKVVVVSRLSDFNPILVGKLGAQCSCQNEGQPESYRRVAVKRVKGRLINPQTTTANYLASTSQEYIPSRGTTFDSQGPIVEIKPLRKVQRIYSTTTALPFDGDFAASIDSGYVTQAPTRGRTVGRKQILKYQTLSESNSVETETKIVSPSVSSGDTVNLVRGNIECQRAGLFRHPNHCNKFYSCNWDPWKKKFTLSVFNCPIHLAYDSNLGACNWPSKGPACSDDNLLV